MSRSSTPRDESDVETDTDSVAALPGRDHFDDREVMASVEESTARPELVIADISRDDAWLAVDQADAPVLAEWA